jgi:poly-gamma-glutamate synthesis protein (capsule biosynthesis protein)
VTVRRIVLALLAVGTLVGGCSTGPATSPPGPIRSVISEASSVPAEEPPSFSVVAAGDVLIHPALTEQAIVDGRGLRDYSALLGGVRRVILGADLAVCHLEVPLAGRAGPFRGFPRFSAPPEVAAGLAGIGYDACSTASNHTLDQGRGGVVSTLDALDAVKIEHVGSARSAEEAATPLIMDVRRAKVALLSYTFAFNVGTAPPSAEPWLGNLLEVPVVLSAAKAARTAGAEVVIVSLHWGTEGQAEPTADQRRIAGQLLADPAVDLIIGHHAHVVQPFEHINGKWVAYGLGNQVARHEQPRGTTEEGVIARFRFVKGPDGWRVEKAEYIPTLVDLGPPIRLRDLTVDTEVNLARKTEAVGRIDAVVRDRGAGDRGLTRPAG